ncbi:MAG: DUF2752 domain-containing protein [Acidobacteria bacterium]|nr:DUF2752 domain-containing protein [Acidobacteriota bacterium]
MNLDSRNTRLTLVAVMATAATVLYRWNPATAGFYPICPFFALSGWYCPGCGSLRAMHQLLHGHVAAAFDLNPLLVLAMPFVAYQVFALLIRHPRLRPFSTDHIPALWVRALGVVLVAFGVLRNLPQYPFTLFAP